MANTSPVFPQTPHIEFGTITTEFNSYIANESKMVKFFTTGINGSLINNIRLVSLGTNPSTLIRIFIKIGNEFSLFNETQLVSTTQGSTALPETNIRLEIPFSANISFWAATSVNLPAGINVICEGEDY